MSQATIYLKLVPNVNVESYACGVVVSLKSQEPIMHFILKTIGTNEVKHKLTRSFTKSLESSSKVNLKTNLR
jgi:hypothetical protein